MFVIETAGGYFAGFDSQGSVYSRSLKAAYEFNIRASAEVIVQKLSLPSAKVVQVLTTAEPVS